MLYFAAQASSLNRPRSSLVPPHSRSTSCSRSSSRSHSPAFKNSTRAKHDNSRSLGATTLSRNNSNNNITSKLSTTSMTNTPSQNNHPDPALLEYFNTKEILWTAYDDIPKVNILLQNANGPCPLVALINTLVLTHYPTAKYTRDKSKISVKGLMEYLGELLIELSDSKESQESATHSEDINVVLKLLPKLVSGLDINPFFDGSFGNDREMALFRSYNVEIVHGWIIDPQSSVYDEIIKTKSYENSQILLFEAEEIRAQENLLRDEKHILDLKKKLLVEKIARDKAEETSASKDVAVDEASENKVTEESTQKKATEDHGDNEDNEAELEKVAKKEAFYSEKLAKFDEILARASCVTLFLEQYPSQLTEYGIKYLHEKLSPGSVAIFFRNDHFSTIYKPTKPLLYLGPAHSGEPNTSEAGTSNSGPSHSDKSNDTGEYPLLMLATDIGLGKRADIIWQSLTSISGNQDDFFDGNLILSSSSPDKPKKSINKPDGGAAVHPTPDISSLENYDQGDMPNLDAEVEQAWDDYGKSNKHIEGEERDLAYAKKLQEEEDERMAARVARIEQERMAERQNNRPQQQRAGRNQYSGTGQSTAVDVHRSIYPKKKKQSTDCIVM